ncbi:MarR family transcriptional regulator [Clostridium sp. CX1]|uniref:MarR family winged helix-turn-helix transcriptional regulator n=1 Tax=Clostridium sp. CX1 TaxID=2978346 RepID=UPI0021C1FB8D|nr:MarR family transcriptional regulator [Clostridium sp. CX1]MCT8978560.1 MarR family transcriptional regulator [Clostridium sp. CX1]
MSKKEVYEIAQELIKVLKLLKRRTINNTDKKGLNISSYMILHLLKDEPRKTLTEISESLGLPNSTASVLVDKLVKEGLVDRIRDSDDRRRASICLTDKAEQYVEGIKVAHMENFGQIMRDASDSELEEILKGLRMLSRTIEGNSRE